MVKYCGYYVTFQEVPNEIALVFTISNCPYKCPGCHSPWLQTNIGHELTMAVISKLLDIYRGAVTCICFMGAGKDPSVIQQFVGNLHALGYKTCVYTGGLQYRAEDFGFPDYFKEGSYVKELGGLNSPDTNQRMWKLAGFDDQGNALYNDITYWFWRRKD